MERDTERRARNRWIAVTCVLLACGLLYVLYPGRGAVSVSDRVGVVGVPIGVLTLVVSSFSVLAARRAAGADDASAARRLSRDVALAEPLTRRLLGGDRVPVELTYTFRRYAHARGASLPLSPAGRLDGLVADYRAIRPRRLVITGQPGAGKSVLARMFVAEATRQRLDGDPVPVLIALGDWEREEPFRDWIVRHLVRDYGTSWRQARNLVDAGLVLPVLDGLDEMDASDVPLAESRAQAALEALTGHQDGLEPAPLVLTCRTDLYDALEARGRPVLDAARSEIDPVGADEAGRFLRLRAGAVYRRTVWDPILRELRDHPRGVLARALSTPWRLVLMATAYEQGNDPRELLTLATEEEVVDTLLGHFIPSAVRAVAGARSRHAPEKVHGWLSTLARALQEPSGRTADLVLPELAHSSGAVWARRMYAALVVVCTFVPALLLLSGWDRDAATWFLLAFLLVNGIAGLWHLRHPRPGGTRLRGRADIALPPWGSPLWRVGIRLAWSGQGRGAMCVGAVLPLLSLWRTFAPERLGGLADPVMGLMLLVCPALFFVMISVYSLGSGPVGPSGWPRTGTFFALVALWPAAIMVFLSRSAGLGPTVDLFVLTTCGSSYLALGGSTAMYACWLLVNCRRLPFRLSRFLEWSREAGLIRVTGAAYQFQQREFRDWLVRHPVPPRQTPTGAPIAPLPARTAATRPT